MRIVITQEDVDKGLWEEHEDDPATLACKRAISFLPNRGNFLIRVELNPDGNWRLRWGYQTLLLPSFVATWLSLSRSGSNPHVPLAFDLPLEQIDPDCRIQRGPIEVPVLYHKGSRSIPICQISKDLCAHTTECANHESAGDYRIEDGDTPDLMRNEDNLWLCSQEPKSVNKGATFGRDLSLGKVKQVIVLRTDLNMRKGKMAAQAAHASIMFLCKRLQKCGSVILHANHHDAFSPEQIHALTDPELEWFEKGFTKIVVAVNNENDLLALYKKATAAGIESHIIQDSGLTEFNGIPKRTCLAIGPDYSSKIDAITGGLKLL